MCWQRLQAGYSRPGLCAVLALILTMPGCGGGSDPAPSEAESSAESRPRSSTSKKTSSGGSKSAGSASDTKNIDGIPLDVYFDNPLQIAADDRTVGQPAGASGAANAGAQMAAASGTSAATPAPAAPEPAPAAAKPAGGSAAWNELMPADLLQEEMKAIRNELSQRLTNFGTYGKSYLEIPVYGATIAVLADAARQHSEDIAWKDQAAVIRTLGGQMMSITSSAAAKNKTAYEEVNGAYLKICEILDKNKPDGLPEVPEEFAMAELAPMNYLMKRLDRSREWLTSNAGSEAAFSSKADAARREVAVQLVIAEFMVTESYGYSDDENFGGYVSKFREALKGMGKAAVDKNFADWDANRSKSSQQCDECHTTGGYRSG